MPGQKKKAEGTYRPAQMQGDGCFSDDNRTV